MIRAAAEDQSGFTLIELLVAMMAGIVVVFALSAILVTTLHQTQRTFSRVDATRQARTAFQTIDNDLHSACVNSNVAPIQATSTASSLRFLSVTGDAVNPIPQYHVLAFSGTTLSEATYNATAGSGNTYTQGSQVGSTVTLLGNATQQTDSAGNAIPVFQYFSYKPFLAADGDYYWAIPDGANPQPVTGAALGAAPLSVAGTGLSPTDAANAVEVVASLNVGASATSITKSNIPQTTTPVTDSISLRLTTPPNNSGTNGADFADYGPCQ